MRVVRNLDSLEKLILKKRAKKNKINERVNKIIKNVKERGDDALGEYTRKFDKVKISPNELRVSEVEISAAFNALDSSLISSFKFAIDNVTKFYKEQLPKTQRLKEANGKVLITRYIPLERIGIYIPAGTAPLISTVYMSVIPARVAGVKDIVLTSPAALDKSINPFILAVASLLKIKEIYRVGGAQAIAALAYGTKTIRKVDKIIGPGNEFVTEAKRQVFGEVGIDMLAGPSEVVILASKDANLDYLTADLDAQMEHSGGVGIVVTNSRKIIRELRKKRIGGFILRVRNLDGAAAAVNRISPEHLEILTKKPSLVLKKIKNAGAIFLGENTPVALGDYTAGPSHILPTSGTARFFSSLSVREFLKEVHIISYTKKALQEEIGALEKIASLEGMNKHIESVRKRL
ncbi:MAG: histidinol dehydrogenase [Candidatus Omnitrophica bacterium]|nr:histidinol dehydrogenase [Candidatus Omnitrophota bacterium]MBU1134257.1 histidinol dehydrogenase [Candidatus Omnitrophota bacterium]MBU1810416.1 histidinol dehydrogenase [Candidatus Omnitrophota bacterium]MBU2436348.1 histidinol dehydrogenase [Candidatus Omnitrophota bacterium]MBU2504172.1 histidinol dehydrogenase [Candidatus Omnitrophota bacterium]